MRIATFNLESFGGNRLDIDELAPRIAVLRPQLLALDADVLCLQEVNAQHSPGRDERIFAALDRLLQDTPYETFHRVASHREGSDRPADRHSMVVVSRLPLDPPRSIWMQRVRPPLFLPRHSEPPAGKPQEVTLDRPILQTALRLPENGCLHLFVVHLRAPIAAALPGAKESAESWKSVAGWAEGLFLSALKRTSQALELRLALEEIFEQEAEPLILVAGDFNAGTVEPALRIVAADPEETGNPALRARRMEILDRSIPDADRHSVLHHGRGRMLDHLIASPALAARLREIKVMNAGLRDEADEKGGTQGSFHAPLIAEFDL
ncbi:endonuclease/exonuclease/phosphatase family protein [Stappia sp. F7233]|uniref:Endonuclease/exonuclease/phosphatase family protein n=1 Tax=Stappia albiluteola TaxID=2758565 RepID=A0A839AFQ0_9HYPH|nr:endonuclease/exonuclease/phosphatase family protein [Stappia albiluteola]MBA5778543.1 endonuclease/exonuclease/phosphatase family protein [Stappia albiluteola]